MIWSFIAIIIRVKGSKLHSLVYYFISELYLSIISISGAVETYTGATMGSFKKRHYGHKTSFENRRYEHATALSTYIWNLKDQRAPFTISWEIIGRAAPYNPATNKCRLCLLEKYLIMFKPAGASLNQNSEFFTTCRQKESHLLGKVKFKKWNFLARLHLPFLSFINLSNLYVVYNVSIISQSDFYFWWDRGYHLARNNVVK